MHTLACIFIRLVKFAPSFFLAHCGMCESVHVHAVLYLLVLLSFHAYGANSHLLFPLPPFAISVIKCISINIAWGNELNLKLDHVKVEAPDSQ